MKIKKKIAAIAAAAIALMGLPTAAFADEEPVPGDVPGYPAQITDFKMGDVNNDGEVTTTDIVILNEYLYFGVVAPGNTLNSYAADMNHDGRVNIYDSILIKRTVMGIREVQEVHIEFENPTEAPTEAPSYEIPTIPVPQDPTEASTEPTDAPVPTEEEPTEAPTEEPTIPVPQDPTEAPTDPIEIPTKAPTEAPTVAQTQTSLTYPAVSTVTTAAVTEAPTEEPTEEISYIAEIDPANTAEVESVSFKVESAEGIQYSGAVQFFDKDGVMYVVNINNNLAENGVIKVNASDAKTKEEESISDFSSIKTIKIVQYWTSDKSDLTFADVKITIGGEEKDPNTEPAKELSAKAVLIGKIGEKEYWSESDWKESDIPTITGNGKYTGTYTITTAGDNVQFLAIAIDGLKGEDYENLKITLDDVKVGGLETEFDLSKAVINTGYKEGEFDGTRIYLTDNNWSGSGANVIPADTAVNASIKVEFTVSGIE